MSSTTTLRAVPAGYWTRKHRTEVATPSLFPTVPVTRDTEPSAQPVAPGFPGHGRSDSGRPTASNIEPSPVLPVPTGSLTHRHRKPVAELVGIARLAASSPQAPSERQGNSRPEYFMLPVRSILNRCDSERVPFEWSVNPYRGCEFGCHYCYARYTHEYMEIDGGEFESKIFVKQDAGPLVSRDLSKAYVWGEHIAIGTATDPYQPAEREFGATRAVLEEIAKRDGLSVSITTKSDRVTDDIDLMRKIAERSSLYVNITVTTPRARLARLLEPRAPRPDLRIAAIKTLRGAGIAAGMLTIPIIPGITDRQADLDALACAARDAGALWFSGAVLFLMPASQKQFFPFLERKFPKLVKQYRQWFLRSGYAPETYTKEIAERIAALRAKYKLGARPYDTESRTWRSPQLALSLPCQERASA